MVCPYRTGTASQFHVLYDFDTNKKALSGAGHPGGAVRAVPLVRAAGFRDGLLQRGCTVHRKRQMPRLN